MQKETNVLQMLKEMDLPTTYFLDIQHNKHL